MTDVSGLTFSLDPLMAEAKRRMRRRRVVLVVAAVVVAAALVLTVQPWHGGGHALGVSASDTAIAQIPGMTRVRSDIVGFCPGPHACTMREVRRDREETWILTSAYSERGRSNVPAAFARAHPGPVIVTDGWFRLASTRQAQQLVRNYFSERPYPTRPAPAVNGGVARKFDFPLHTARAGVPAPDIEFFWARGRTVVYVSVVGVRLTAAEAQQIARLAHPPVARSGRELS